MRSEHNRGASLAAFLLAVSTMTLLFVSPVEGQECTTNADCGPSEPFCDVPEGATEGECGVCVVSAFPGAAGSCQDNPVGVFAGPQLCARTGGTSVCIECARFENFGITTAADCELLSGTDFGSQTADVVANCQRACFDYYACTTDADCQNAPSTVAVCTNGQCGACEVNAFPGAAGSCPDTDSQGRPVALLCQRGTCSYCGSLQVLSECSGAYDADGPDQVANCQRNCFDFYACDTNADCPADRPLCDAGQCLAECGTNADCPADRPLCESAQCLAECGTNADCPADRPLCDAGQCVVSSVTSSPTSSPTFSPLAGMGGGSLA